jgi:hypothetical protein
MENTNGSDYVKDLDQLEDLLTILVRLQEYLEENVVRYPLAMRVYTAVLYGVVPVIECPECGEQINPGVPCGGLADVYDVIDEAIEALDLEVKFGGEDGGQIRD